MTDPRSCECCGDGEVVYTHTHIPHTINNRTYKIKTFFWSCNLCIDYCDDGQNKRNAEEIRKVERLVTTK